MSLLLRMLVNPPVSYLFEVAIGFLIGAGVQLTNIGFSGISIIRMVKNHNTAMLKFLAILAIFIGTLLAIIGSILFLTLIIDGFMFGAYRLSLYINIFLVIVTVIILIIPIFLRKRNKEI